MVMKVATSREEIRGMLKCARVQKAKYMPMVCDTFDYSDYPVPVMSIDGLQEAVTKYSQNMQKVIEIYDLSQDTERQLNEYRAGQQLINKLTGVD